MEHETDLLERVIAELTNRDGQLRKVAIESGVPYDTVLRIKNRENDPGYSKVKTLADYLGVVDRRVDHLTAAKVDHKADRRQALRLAKQAAQGEI